MMSLPDQDFPLCFLTHTENIRILRFKPRRPKTTNFFWNASSITISKGNHKYGRRTVKAQLYSLQIQVVYLAINNYMFQPLYWPSSGCTPCYKATTQYTCLLLMTISRSQNFVAWTNINSSGTGTKCS